MGPPLVTDGSLEVSAPQAAIDGGDLPDALNAFRRLTFLERGSFTWKLGLVEE